jgi:hypothetical protein
MPDDERPADSAHEPRPQDQRTRKPRRGRGATDASPAMGEDLGDEVEGVSTDERPEPSVAAQESKPVRAPEERPGQRNEKPGAAEGPAPKGARKTELMRFRLKRKR